MFVLDRLFHPDAVTAQPQPIVDQSHSIHAIVEEPSGESGPRPLQVGISLQPF
jgi:hypothetical protein